MTAAKDKTPDHGPLPDDLSYLQDFIPRMAEKSVLVIGDIMLDRFIYGDANRISPEGPIPVLTVKRETQMLGGAGNVLSNLSGLGVKTHILSIVGDDAAAQNIRQIVKGYRADCAGILTTKDRPTIVKTRFIAASQQLLRTDWEQIVALPADIEKAIIANALTLIPQVQAIVLSDYGKGMLTKTLIAAVIAAARAAGVPVLVDPKAKDYTIYTGASIITPNSKELANATTLPTDTDDHIEAAAKTLLQQTKITAIVATRSQDGMSILGEANDPALHLKTKALEVFDVSGAGDTVIAVIAAAIAAGANIYEAAAIANIAAGIVVAKIGTAPIRHEELLSALASVEPATKGGQGPKHFRQAPLCSWEEAAEHVGRWHARGLKVGFTNGCFDILHSGHTSYLNMARARCDRLVVAINCDDSISRLKGAERPINDQISRAAVLGALGSVDLVVLFGSNAAESDEPVLLLKKLTPDVLIKGDDYTIDTVIGADYVLSTGGEVWLAPLEKGKSTTKIIEKLKKPA